jgi:formate-dependent nitrite reductase membrane component NrfD
MLRVFKPHSPMSVGAWVLAAFGTASGAAAFAELLTTKYDVGPVRIIGNLAETFACAAALPLTTYTGVLIGSSVIPVWNHNIKSLPVHFGMSGLNSGVSVLELLGHDRSHALNLLCIGASALETYEGFHLEFKRAHEINRPLKRGRSGWITRLGGIFSGPVPLALRLAAEFASPMKSRKLRRAAAASSIAGSLCTRIGWLQAGRASAKDWRLPLELRDEVPRKKSPLQSQDDLPRIESIGD